MTIWVLLADDQSLLRLGFRMVLEAQPDIDERLHQLTTGSGRCWSRWHAATPTGR